MDRRTWRAQNPTVPADLDAVVVGAGFSGLAGLHLRRARGPRVRAYEEVGEVGFAAIGGAR